MTSILQRIWEDTNSDTHSDFASLLFYYSSRQVTYASDILKAIDGICHRLSIRWKFDLLQGMPVAFLDLYLLFHTADTTERRHGFPSYSWASWNGQIFIDSVDDSKSWLSNQTWIIWYKYEPSNGTVSLVWDSDQHSGFPTTSENDVEHRSRRIFRSNSAAARLSGNMEITKPSTRYNSIDHTQHSYPLLQFWTVTAYFRAAVYKEHGIGRFNGLVLDVFDRNDDYCGCVYSNTSSTYIQRQDKEPLELILLSACWRSGDMDDTHVLPAVRRRVYWNRATEKYARDFDDKLFLWALWIRWDGGVAERVGIGQIFHTAVEESLEPGPTWKEILLG